MLESSHLLLNEFREEFVRLVRALLHAGLKHSVAVLFRVELRTGDELRPATAQVFERERVHRYVAGHALPLERPDDLTRRHDFAILSAEPVFLDSIRPAMQEPVLPARPEVHLAKFQRVPARPPPVREVLTSAMRLEDELPWGVELASHHDLPVRRYRYRQLLLFDHCSSSFFRLFGDALSLVSAPV